MNPFIEPQKTIAVFFIALVCFGLSSSSRAADGAVGAVANGNTAEGAGALGSLTSGVENTAMGFDALKTNTKGNDNTATGFQALFSNSTNSIGSGNGNTATGSGALKSNIIGTDNTATGYQALFNNTSIFRESGFNNTATGSTALFHNTTGHFDTANGSGALFSNTTGNFNTATGNAALSANQTGNNNTADGVQALGFSSGSNNIALGFNAGLFLTTGDNNIDIGAGGMNGESGIIRIGTSGTQTATFIAGISGVVLTGGAVRVTSSGQLGVATSSARFKDQIKPMDKTSETILALKPVSFRYKKDIDPEGTRQFGLVAEEVEKVNPDLVEHDRDGKPFTVRYEAVDAMLLNEFLKEHRRVEEQQKKITALAAQLKEQAVLIQKVSHQLELSKPAPQLVANNQ